MYILNRAIKLCTLLFKKESLLLFDAKSCLGIVGKAHSKPQKTIEFEKKKQKVRLSIDVLLELSEKWTTGVTSSEVYNTVEMFI